MESWSQPDIDKLDIVNEEIDLKSHIPAVWTLDDYLSKKQDYPWLFVHNGQLGCLSCTRHKLLGAEKSQGVRISKEWSSGTVSDYGNNREKQLKSLRKKKYEHKISNAHKKCEKITLLGANKIFENINTKVEKNQLDTYCRVFRTAYKIAKTGRPFVDLETDVDLQDLVLNGLDMGRTLHSNVSCANITDHIADEMRVKVLSSIIKARHKFFILIDESTTLSRKRTLIIYMRLFISSLIEPNTFFLDLLE